MISIYRIHAEFLSTILHISMDVSILFTCTEVGSKRRSDSSVVCLESPDVEVLLSQKQPDLPIDPASIRGGGETGGETGRDVCIGHRLYRSCVKYWTMVQHLLLFFTIFEVLEDPIHRGNELETSNYTSRHNKPCKNIIQHRDMCWCKN
jgi:hypothetical protein